MVFLYSSGDLILIKDYDGVVKVTETVRYPGSTEECKSIQIDDKDSPLYSSHYTTNLNENRNHDTGVRF